jgi:long-chain fatty acid transport protein
MYFTHRINDAWTVGATVNAPFGFQTEYDDRSMLRYEGVKSKLESIDLAFGASFRINDQFSIGGSLIAQRTSAELTQVVDFGTILAAPTNGALLPQEADGFGGLKGDDWGYGFTVGLLWKPTANDRFGLSYNSQIDHTLQGDATFQVPSNVLPLLGGAFLNQDGQAEFDTPWFVTASWWHTFDDRLSFGADIGYTHWSSFKDLLIRYQSPAMTPFTRAQDFNWDDTWFYSVGGEYRLDDQWTLRAGLAYDETPTNDITRTPRVPDGNRTWLSVGIGYKWSDALRFDAGFVHLWVDDGTIDHTTSTFNHLTGSFESSGNVLGISGQYLF